MSLFSHLVKCLATLLMAGGATIGSVFGAINYQETNEFQAEQIVIDQVTSPDNSDSEREQEASLSAESSFSEDLNLVAPKEELQQHQAFNRVEKVEEPPAKEIGPQASGFASNVPVSVQESKTTGLGKINPPLESGREKPAFPAKNTVENRSHKPHLRRPRPTKRFSSKPEAVIAKQDSAKNQDWTNKNWFLVKWSEKAELDGSSWSFDECERTMKDENVMFVCHWNGEQSKVIELHLSPSADNELRGKEWDKLEELHFTSISESAATLGVIFFDNVDSEIITVLERKIS